MTRLCWLTDIHLNFLRTPEASQRFGEYLCQEQEFDVVLVSGDIAEAPNVHDLISRFAKGVAPRLVYFVLGNHDFYRGSFAGVKQQMRDGFTEPNLVWLDEAGCILLDEDTALVGHQGWFDARLGDPEKSRVIMNDFTSIKELEPLFYNELNWLYGGRAELIAEIQKIGLEAAEQLKPALLEALAARPTVIVVTHFPPFKGACWHQGGISDKHWMPWFTCYAMGMMLAEVAKDHPDRSILVLCGHTHSPGTYEHLPNLKVLTGAATYGVPSVAGLFTTPITEA